LVQVRRAYKFRAFPTRPQEGRAVRLLADHCDLYNAALMERREAWQMRHVRIGYGVQSAQLKEIRRADPGGQGLHSFTAQQQTLRRLNTVFTAFFDRVKPGKEKAAEAGRRLVLVNPAGTSINCHRCGRRCERPQRKTVMCPVHGAIDADVNGARNIASRAGLGSGQAPTAA
jgi:transposase